MVANMLLKKVLKMKVYTSLGDLVGTLVNIYIEQGSWEIKFAMVSKGMGKQNKMCYPVNYLIFGEGSNLTILPENVFETVPLKELSAYIPGNHLIGCEVLTSDKKVIGKLYDADVSVSYKKWTLWKILTRSSAKKRRMRLDATKIDSIGKNIQLNQTYKEFLDEK